MANFIIIFITALLVVSIRSETCVDKFCPLGTFCEEHEVQCLKAPCTPILVCTPDSQKGCKSHPPCPAGQVCVEKLVPCISKSCKKEAKCAPEGTCEATECPPSHKCEMNPNPVCVKIA